MEPTGPGTHLVYQSPFDDSASYTVPTGVLRDGKTYWWRAQSWDICAPPAGMCSLTDGSGTTRTLNASASRTFSVAMQHLGGDQRWTTFSHDVGSGMTAQVNESNGNLYLDVPLDSYPTQIGDLGVGLSYNSQSGTDYGLSPGWDLALGSMSTADLPVALTPPATSDDPVTLRMRGSRVMYFPNLSGNVYESPGSGVGTVRKNSDNTWLYEAADGSTYSFNASGNLTKAKPSVPADASNGAAFTYTVNTYGHFTKVTDPLGRAINLTWATGATGKLTGVSSWTGQTWAVSYDSSGRLTAVDATVTAAGQPTHHEIEAFSYVGTGGTGAGLLGQVSDAAIQAKPATGWMITYTQDPADALHTIRVATITAPGGARQVGMPSPHPLDLRLLGSLYGSHRGICLHHEPRCDDGPSVYRAATPAGSAYPAWGLPDPLHVQHDGPCDPHRGGAGHSRLFGRDDARVGLQLQSALSARSRGQRCGSFVHERDRSRRGGPVEPLHLPNHGSLQVA